MTRSNDATERLFRAAGISARMSVLELGCGHGEVTELLAEIVGPDGTVLAVDRSHEMVALARKRVDELGLSNVRLVQGDLNAAPEGLGDVDRESFDAIAGRRVLMYLENPSGTLSALLPWLKSDGLAVFEETDSTICPGHVVSMPAHEQGMELIGQMLQAEGANQSMGFLLPATLSNAGLRFDRIWAEAVIDGQGEQYTVGELLHLLAPRLQSAGAATSSEVDALVAQIQRETESTTVFLSGMRFCASAWKSG